MTHLKRNMPESMRIQSPKDQDSDSLNPLLSTILIPKGQNICRINEKLPKANYMKKNSSMPSFGLPDLNK